MGKMKELVTTQDIVMEILKNEKKARNSDMFLYIKVCQQINPKVLNEPFWFAMMNLKDYNLPCIETVRRTRQKIQADHPELAADSNVEAQRMLNEEDFNEYAVGVLHG